MRRHLLCVITVALVAIVLIQTGCASDPTTRWAQNRVALTTTQDALTSAWELGALSKEDFLSTEPLILSIRTGLEKAEAKLPEGGPVFDQIMEIVEDYLSRLQKTGRSP